MMQKTGKPLLSIIIASYNSQDMISDCLISLDEQSHGSNFETIVVDSSNDGTPQLIKNNFPDVTVIECSERKFPGDARNIGIKEASGDIVAFIDADCRADIKWAENIIRAHKNEEIAVSGSVGNVEDSGYVGWASYFCEFSHWMPTGDIKYLEDAPCTGMSYKKKIFDEIGGFLKGTYCSDTDFHWRLGKTGRRIFFDPSICIYHNSIDTFNKYLKHEYFHGNSFAKVRLKSQGFSVLKRYIYILFSLLIPLRILFKIVVNNIKNRVYLMHFVRTFPLLAMGVISWSMGECAGYFKGR